MISGKDDFSFATSHVQSALTSGWEGMRSVGSMVLERTRVVGLFDGIEARSQRPKGK